MKRGWRIAFLGIEHQNEKDYFMPARVISYDGSCYRAQLLERKNRSGITAGDEKRLKKRRKLYPVVTLVLYFGTSHWNQGKSLYEILDMPEDFKPFVNDYKINIVEVAYLSEEQIQKFQSDFRIVAEYFSQKRQYGKYEPKRIEIKHVDEILKLLGVMARDDRFPEVIEAMNEEKEKKGRVTMCEVLDEIENRGIQKGIQKGIRKGIQQERVHTEEQRLRAEEAEARAKAAEAEVERLRKLLASQG
ncbi:MAG: Rpn family recombination-promoting nuclease/putative transposase [Lachnospiraceae bacterium]|nr:Rpn family recombination-promoting nuclease/putative transposase [Lachnospiraceae bacterium]